MSGVVTVSPIGAVFLSEVGFEFHVPHFPPLLNLAEGSHTFAGMLGQHSPTKKAVASLYSFVMQAGATPALSTKCQVSMHI